MSQDKPAASEEYRRRICRAIDFINANLEENPTVAEIAQAAPFSSFHFQRLFRALIGESVAQFTRRLRLESAARRLLFRPKDDITAITFDLGFSSSQNFAKAFRKHFGVSPTQYREQSGAGADSGRTITGRDASSMSSLDGDRISIDDSIQVQDLPASRVVYRRHFGSYNDSEVHAAFQELVRWAKPRGLDIFERYLGIPWDDADVTADEKCRFDA